ncbi:MAG: ABC transporter permease [Acidimicrobiales bacterium]|jgi:peptide/nickel transport system permease protein
MTGPSLDPSMPVEPNRAVAPSLPSSPARPFATPPPDEDFGLEADSVSLWHRAARRFVHDRVAMVGLVVIVLVVVTAIFAPWIWPQNPITQHLNELNQTPSRAHWLGTDFLGRDVLSRLIQGARVSMQVCLGVVLLAIAVALPIGLVSGYVGGWVDGVIMRVMDAMFTLPTLALALAVAALLGPSVFHTSVAIAIGFVPGFVRLVRGQALAVREEAYIEASRSIGVSQFRMIRRHVLPNVAAPLIVQVAVSFGYALLAEAGLSFLGLGVQPPNASWGTMLEYAFSYILSDPWGLFPPGIAIAITVLAFNLVGDGLRDSLGRETFVARSKE